MKKKIAVLANGWNEAPLFQVLEGIKRFGTQYDFDIFVFVSCAADSADAASNQGELNIYNLCRMQNYDGIIVFSNMLNAEEKAKELCQKAKYLRVPVVSIGMEMDGIPFVGINNEVGMYQLVTHLIEVHQVKRAVYIGGTRDHVDSKARLNITQIVMASHGLTLKEKDIYYGDWGYRRVIQIIMDIIKDPEGLPDAIICANDNTALAAASELVRRGYHLPEDVIITGFDHIEDGQTFYPALTTVTQNYEEVGYECAKQIFAQMENRVATMSTITPSRMTLGESCGCQGDLDYVKIRRNFCCEKFYKGVENSVLETMERNFQREIAEASDYDDLKQRLRRHYERSHNFEGANFYINMCTEYMEHVMEDEEEIWKNGYQEKVEVMVALRHGKLLECSNEISIWELIPDYQKEEGVCHIHYVMPMRVREYNYGYVVWVDPPLLRFKGALVVYMEKFQQAMQVLRTNIRLVELNRHLTRIYDKDPMTGLFNRFGYEVKAKPLFEQSLVHKTTMMVMFVDINYMKKINDQFGHIHGDNAIRTVADAIRENVKPESIAVRFGGDEFLIIAPECSKEDAEKAKNRILEYLEITHNESNLPYRISTSIGYVITDPEAPGTLQDYIKEADNAMYEVKREIHAKDGFPTK